MIDNIQHSNKKRVNFLLLISIAAIVVLLVAAIIKIITPTSEKIVVNDFAVNNYDDTQSTFKKISFSGNEITIPETFNIYQAQNSTGLADELANKLLIEYQLVADDDIENYWLSNDYALAKNSYEHYYTFKGATPDNGSKNLAIIANSAIEVCQNFYSKYNINLPLIPQEDALIYLDSGFEQNVVESNQATFLQIPLTYELDGYKVFYENQNSYPFFCRVDNLYNLERVVFRDFFQEFQVVRQMSAISINQAVNNIKKGNASIIDAESDYAVVIDLNWINEADLYSVSIEYRYDSELKIAYPFYKFQAKLTNSAGINIQAEIITPAIANARED